MNDLMDLAPGALARVCESDDPILDATRGSSPDLTDAALPATLSLRLNTQVPTRDPEVRARLEALRPRVATTSLTNLNSARINEAVTAGFVATMRAMDPSATSNEVLDALQQAEEQLRLGQRLSSTWKDLAEPPQEDQPESY